MTYDQIISCKVSTIAPYQRRSNLQKEIDVHLQQPTRAQDGKRKKLSARKDVQNLIKELDPLSCGLPCQTAPVPPEDVNLNEEYKELFPESKPTG